MLTDAVGGRFQFWSDIVPRFELRASHRPVRGGTVYLALVPLGFLLWQSFFTPQTAAAPAQFTLGNYRDAYGSPRHCAPVLANR